MIKNAFTFIVVVLLSVATIDTIVELIEGLRCNGTYDIDTKTCKKIN